MGAVSEGRAALARVAELEAENAKLREEIEQLKAKPSRSTKTAKPADDK